MAVPPQSKARRSSSLARIEFLHGTLRSPPVGLHYVTIMHSPSSKADSRLHIRMVRFIVDSSCTYRNLSTYNLAKPIHSTLFYAFYLVVVVFGRLKSEDGCCECRMELIPMRRDDFCTTISDRSSFQRSKSMAEMNADQKFACRNSRSKSRFYVALDMLLGQSENFVNFCTSISARLTPPNNE